VPRELPAVPGSPDVGSFDRNVADDRVEFRKRVLEEVKDVSCESARAGPGFDQEKRIGPAERDPHLPELPPEQTGEDGTDVCARKVIAAGLLIWFRVVAVLRIVQAGVHILGEGDRPLAADPLDENRTKGSRLTSGRHQSRR
jgi:hypothetical protein